jgi:flagellar protein FlaG
MSSDAMKTVRMPAWSPRPAQGAAGASDRPAASTRGSEAVTAPSVAAEAVTAVAVKDAAKAIETYMKNSNRNLEFKLDEASGQMVVSVRDATTGDLIRQIPGEAALRLARQLNDQPVSLVNLKV